MHTVYGNEALAGKIADKLSRKKKASHVTRRVAGGWAVLRAGEESLPTPTIGEVPCNTDVLQEAMDSVPLTATQAKAQEQLSKFVKFGQAIPTNVLMKEMAKATTKAAAEAGKMVSALSKQFALIDKSGKIPPIGPPPGKGAPTLDKINAVVKALKSQSLLVDYDYNLAQQKFTFVLSKDGEQVAVELPLQVVENASAQAIHRNGPCRQQRRSTKHPCPASSGRY
jgi:hypothetical protein